MFIFIQQLHHSYKKLISGLKSLLSHLCEVLDLETYSVVSNSFPLTRHILVPTSMNHSNESWKSLCVLILIFLLFGKVQGPGEYACGDRSQPCPHFRIPPGTLRKYSCQRFCFNESELRPRHQLCHYAPQGIPMSSQGLEPLV